MKPNGLYLSALVVLALALPREAMAQNDDNRFRIAFYNLENLFHPEDDSLKSDGEFTPEGMRNWSYYRYREKSNRMAKAILSIGEWQPAEVIGVAEIENRQVLEDLVAGDVLRKFNYGIIHYESPDRRGIDVGMLYLKDRFTPIFSKNVPVKMPDDPGFATRDILYVKGLAEGLDSIHLMFCHWPSRYGGQAQSEPKRIQAALTVRRITDSIRQAEPGAKIIIAGDLNDEYHNVSVAEYLGAEDELPSGESPQLVNLMALLDKDAGSHRYRGVWSYLDQIVVSSNLLPNVENDEPVEIAEGKAAVFRSEFLVESDDRYPGEKPFRSFLGMRYHGGFSDHLPVYIDLVLTDEND